MRRLEDYRYRIEQAKGARDKLSSQIDESEKEIKRLQKEIVDSKKAQVIIQTVARQTQEQLEFHLSELVTLALQGIFPNPYDFRVDLLEKRGKTECDLYFEKDGQRVDPMTGSGGGPVDVASFALRSSVWALKKNRNVMILDEPFRFLSKNLHGKASNILSEISERLKTQIIMVTHSDELAATADRIFEIQIKKGRSEVRQR